MGVKPIPNPTDIAISGLRAQDARMRAISANIANAFTSRTAAGEPYRRRRVVLGPAEGELAGVEVLRVVSDQTTPFSRVLDPGHPDADAQGYLSLPNVQLPLEMVNLMTASRAYQANAAVLKRYQEMVDVTLELLR